MTRTARLSAATSDRVETHVIGMAEAGFRGLSEHWLLKRLGDIHWQMIAEAAGQAAAVFVTPDGRPAYAAFCAISLEMPGMARPQPGDRIAIASRLHRAAPTRLGSRHRIVLDGTDLGGVRMISAFVARDGGGAQAPVSAVDLMPAAALDPDPAITALMADARALARGARASHLGLSTATDGAVVLRDRPCPATAFNAAGLLYFPSFVALADRAEWDSAGQDVADLVTERRDILFHGNIAPGDAVVVRRADGGAGHHAMVIAAAAGQTLARVFTRKIQA